MAIKSLIKFIYNTRLETYRRNCIVPTTISKQLSSCYISILYVKEICPEDY